MKINYKKIGIIGIIFISIYTCNHIISNKLQENINETMKPYLEEKEAINDIEQAALITNKSLPITNPDGMILYRVIYQKKDNTIKYYYRFPDVVKNLNIKDIANYKNNWKINLINTIKNDSNNKSFIKADVKIYYQLVDKNNKQIFDFIVKPTEYK